MRPALIAVQKRFFRVNTCLITYNPCTLLPHPLLSLLLRPAYVYRRVSLPTI